MPDVNALRLATLADDATLAERFWPQKQRIWPGYMFEDWTSNRMWSALHDFFADFQLYLLDEDGNPIAVAQSAPLVWDGTVAGLPVGWDRALQQAADGQRAGLTPNTLNALEIAVKPEWQGQGVSYRMVKALRARAEAAGFQAVIVAVRPSWKDRYPLTPMARYVRWQREDGTPFDPWLRVHWRCGGEILKVAHPSMVIEGSIAQWEAWTEMAFPDSGEYIVPGALAPVEMDLFMDIGRYVEPNIWVHHPITTARIS
ncbi:MAG: GNAT family N-acetyltransferase [Caldilineaceae bacterium]|nr:GNAT family N-acetyltransferase [Caldilineaceae bacterium]